MPRYVVSRPSGGDPNAWGVLDTLTGAVSYEVSHEQAKERSKTLNYANRNEQLRKKIATKSDKTVLQIDRIMHLRDVEGLSFEKIARELSVTAPLIHRLYHREADKRAMAAKLGNGPISDETTVYSVKHLLPVKVYLAIRNAAVGDAEVTVGQLRRTPDAVLKATPQVGASAIKIVRDLFGYAPDYRDMTVYEFMLMKETA